MDLPPGRPPTLLLAHAHHVRQRPHALSTPKCHKHPVCRGPPGSVSKYIASDKIESCAVTLDFLVSFAKNIPEAWTTAEVCWGNLSVPVRWCAGPRCWDDRCPNC